MRPNKFSPVATDKTIIMRMKTYPTLLGGFTVDEFLRDYWQKKPLLIRGALPQFTGLLTPEQAIKLSCSEDTQARLIKQRHGQFELEQ